MEKTTGAGLGLANGLILMAMGSGIMAYVDFPSVLIVFGGCSGCMMLAYPMSDIIRSLKAFKVVLFPQSFEPEKTVKLLAELSRRARRDGLLSLEEAADESEDDFLARGLRLMVDGQEQSAIEAVLYDEIGKIDERHRVVIGFWDTLGAYGPGMGLIGTLIGLIQMLGNMSDPTTIGPAMAVALLTTFYGAYLANILAIPVSNKMKIRSGEEVAHKELIAQGLLSILGGENPRFMVERLNAILPPGQRETEEAA
jgi:chemotaxis protein MotA